MQPLTATGCRIRDARTLPHRRTAQNGPSWLHGGCGGRSRRGRAGRGDAQQSLRALPILVVMEPHFHAWLRSGASFTMDARLFADRTTAHRWTAKQRPNKADRLVPACTGCPPTRPSKRRPPRWATVARQVAAAVGAEPTAVRAALAPRRALLTWAACIDIPPASICRMRQRLESAGGSGSHVAAGFERAQVCERQPADDAPWVLAGVPFAGRHGPVNAPSMRATRSASESTRAVRACRSRRTSATSARTWSRPRR